MTDRRSNRIWEGPGVSVALSHYAPGSVMCDHTHDTHHVSLIMTGELEESSGRNSLDLTGPSLGFKGAGREHANRYGPNGALILSASFNPNDPIAETRTDTGWHWRPANSNDIRLARAMTMASEMDSLLDYAADLVAGVDGTDDDRSVSRPGWAVRLREQLREESGTVDLEAAAACAGVHRAHLSRGFRRCFGMPPSLYALRCRLARGVRYLAEGACGSHAAHDAGFADQSHFIRTLKRETGFTPEVLRGLLAAR